MVTGVFCVFRVLDKNNLVKDKLNLPKIARFESVYYPNMPIYRT